MNVPPRASSAGERVEGHEDASPHHAVEALAGDVVWSQITEVTRHLQEGREGEGGNTALPFERDGREEEKGLSSRHRFHDLLLLLLPFILGGHNGKEG